MRCNSGSLVKQSSAGKQRPPARPRGNVHRPRPAQRAVDGVVRVALLHGGPGGDRPSSVVDARKADGADRRDSAAACRKGVAYRRTGSLWSALGRGSIDGRPTHCSTIWAGSEASNRSWRRRVRIHATYARKELTHLALTRSPTPGESAGHRPRHTFGVTRVRRWRRWELNPRPRSRERWLLRVCPALWISPFASHAGGVAKGQPDQKSPRAAQAGVSGALACLLTQPDPGAGSGGQGSLPSLC